MRTLPVKYSAGPMADGCEPLRMISMVALLSRGFEKAGHFNPVRDACGFCTKQPRQCECGLFSCSRPSR
jgi:hypothetical protein